MPMRVLRRTDETATFSSHQHVVWRARALNGGLLLQHTPGVTAASPDSSLDNGADGEAANDRGAGSNSSRRSTVELHECAFEWQHALRPHYWGT